MSEFEELKMLIISSMKNVLNVEEIEAYLTQNKTMSLEEINQKADNYVTY